MLKTVNNNSHLTVKELIEILQEMNGNKIVHLAVRGNTTNDNYTNQEMEVEEKLNAVWIKSE